MRAAALLGAVAIGGVVITYLWKHGLSFEPRAELEHAAAPKPTAAPRDFVPEPQPAATAIPQLEEMSQTFRNTTFLISIRDAGYACDDVVAAHRTARDVWTASCRDLLGYTISVDESGALAVAPVPHYFDGIGPPPAAPEDRYRLDREPNRLNPQPRPR